MIVLSEYSLSEKNKKIQVLQVLGSLEVGGLQTFILDIIEHIDKDRFQVDVCEMATSPGELAYKAESNGARVFQCSQRSNPLTFGKRFSRVLHEGGYHVVEVTREGMSGFVIKVAAECGIPMRITHFQSMDNGPDKIFNRSLNALSMKYIDRYSTNIIGCSKGVLEYYYGNRWKDDNRFCPIYNSIKLDRFQVDDSASSGLRSEFNIPEDGFIIGTCARIDPIKNYELCVELAVKVLDQMPNMYYLWIGGGPEKESEKLRRKIAECDLEKRFIVTGNRPDVPQCLNLLDIFVLLSKWEGFSLSISEAQAAGLPCVTSNAKAFRESVCPEMQEYSFDLNAGTDRIAKAIIELSKDRKEREHLGECGSEYVKMFDIKHIVKQVENLYLAGMSGVE